MSHPYDVVVVGGGHAGIEAALAAARMGARAALISFDAQAIGRMSCNPAIGGLGKGQMVREIDALGGEMAKAADASGIQFRWLNTRKGPAVRAPRCQSDKKQYQDYMVRVCHEQVGLDIIASKVEGLRVGPSRGHGDALIRAVVLDDGSEVPCRAAVLTNGTFLRGLMHCGESKTRGGRIGEDAAYGLSDVLLDLGFERGRLKTGTPARVEASTVDWSQTSEQPGDENPVPFSHFTSGFPLPQISCHIAYTNEETHEAIRSNLHRAPMYSGEIEGVGPRYCPSIEDKIVRFADKSQHQVFLEPEGLDTSWIYLNGISTSLPQDVQDAMLASIPALAKAKVHQYGYAVEYDFFPPTQIDVTFETRRVEGLYFAGQICGTSGYEEAAAQGLLAGVNAVRKIREEEPLVLDRSQAYLGVLIDDLVKECPREPYRMFTSRAEYRLVLRSDNADERLMPIGHELGLIPDEALDNLQSRRGEIRRVVKYMESTYSQGKTLAQHARRPDTQFRDCLNLKEEGFAERIPADVIDGVEIDIKYAPYIERQQIEIDRFRRAESKLIPSDFDYDKIVSLRGESREKLQSLKPRSLGQASRISGVTPADISILLAHLEGTKRQRLSGRPSS
ncbi:MAG: tRNA uridine-5-carboxymethylaminomethyl(34) synthesis enzyme MnmG [Planctomycetota bacterium]